MMHKIIIVILLSFFSCQGAAKKEQATVDTDTAKNTAPEKRQVHTETQVENTPSGADLLAILPIRHFPITDSTRFDNYEKSGIPDHGLLKKINFDPRRKDATHFRLHYTVPFSKNFSAVAVSYRGGENELFTILITVNQEGRIIDKLEIAYDEVAESAFSKTSRIEKDAIWVTSANWMSEVPIFETQLYSVESDGTFQKVDSDSVPN
ncbi:hypothetical protein [Sphingobacterium suaedae]|uniref:Lipoprotein n=1 Tax=Sphingobacterium suaedae TaxID=1686402 RepID=A0ABW5KGM3_9SPHI